MRGGVLQQVGPPKELYDAPANVFVAGFLGSPPMNFVPATIDGEQLVLPFGNVKLPDQRRHRLQASGSGRRDVLAGLRPEEFDDAEIGDPGHRSPGVELCALPELVEELGGEMLVHFATPDPRTPAAAGRRAAEDNGTGQTGSVSGQLVARLGAASRATRGRSLRLWLNTDRVELFDPLTGENLRLRRT
jgi:multiple sugar transport system ATP-binding protein